MPVTSALPMAVEIDNLGHQQRLGFNTAVGALALQAFVDEAFMGGVLVDEHEAIPRLGNNVVVMNLGARIAKGIVRLYHL